MENTKVASQATGKPSHISIASVLVVLHMSMDASPGPTSKDVVLSRPNMSGATP